MKKHLFFLPFTIFAVTVILLITGCGDIGVPDVNTTTTSGGTTTSTNSTTTTSMVPTGGATYYVSPAGNNTNDGSLSHPWATPGYGSKQLQPGDTLVILGGKYVQSVYDADIVTPMSGNTNQWIIISGEVGNRPVLAGKGSLLNAVDIGGKSYILIKDLIISSEVDVPYTGGLRDGIGAGGSSANSVSNIIIQNVEIHDIEETGINFGGDIQDIVVENTSIHYTGGVGISGPAGIGNGWERVVIHDSYVGYTGHFYQGRASSEAISPWERPDGIGMESSKGPLEIYNCLFEHNNGDGVDSKSKNTYVHHTIIANNKCDSLKFWGDGSKAENVLIYGDGDGTPNAGAWSSITIDTPYPGTLEFVNVTVDENETRENYPIYMQYSETAKVNVKMKNCIVAHYDNNVIYLGDSVSLEADHNIFYRTGNASVPLIYVNGRDYLPSELSELGAGNFSADPLYVSRAWGTTGDYHLQSGSPAINAGTSNGAPTTDLDYNPRPEGGAIDIGAYEKE